MIMTCIGLFQCFNILLLSIYIYIITFDVRAPPEHRSKRIRRQFNYNNLLTRPQNIHNSPTLYDANVHSII